MNRNKAWRRLLELLQAERQEVRSIYTFGIFQGLVALSLPLGIQAIITFLQAGSLSTSWYVLVAFVLGGILIGGYLQLKQLNVTETIEQRVFVNSAFQLAERLPRLSSEQAHLNYIPETLNRFFEIPTIQKGISKLLIDFSAAIITLVFGIIVLTIYHPTFLLLAVILTASIIAFFKYSVPKGLQTSLLESKYKYAVAHWLQEVGRTMRVFKLAGDSELPLQRTNQLTESYLEARNVHFKILMRQYRTLILFKLMLAAILIILGSVLVVNNLINIGQFVAAEIIILLLINSIEKIILNISTVYDVLTSIEKLGGVMDMPLERDGGQAVPNPQSLQLDVVDLHFQFSDAQRPLLHQLNLHVKAGESICIQGHDGSGKTTLIRLLSGYYENFDGQIAYNNLSIKALHLQNLRAVLGENFAENEIFAGTLAENISCGRPSITPVLIMEALAKVELINWFQSLSSGLNTALTPEGLGLPGHIRRRLMLARNFAGNPGLVLVEDTALSQGEDDRLLFYNLLFKHCQGITTIVVSNDPKIAQRCSRTLLLKNGTLTTITEQL